MSRLYEAMAAKELDTEPRIYRGEFSGQIYIQFPWPKYEPVEIGPDLRMVEDLRDRLTAFLDGEWRSE